jgi:ribonuclease PH
MRPSGRAPDQLRPVSLEPGFSRHAEGSCLVKFGDTHVLCTASVDERVPPWMRNSGRGWVRPAPELRSGCYSPAKWLLWALQQP